MEEPREVVRRTLTQVKALLAQESSPRLTEADTKAHFIEPVVSALGWTGIGIVTREYYVKNSQEFIDYVMTGTSGPVLAIEAKALQTSLTEKHAAQLIQYCSVEGIEWAALTNGRELQFFNTFLKPDLLAKRILGLDMLAFNNDEEFEAIFQQLWQLSRERMTTPTGVRSWLNQRRMDAALRGILLNSGSPVIKQLRKTLMSSEVSATPQDLVQWFRSHLGTPIATLPISPRQPATPEHVRAKAPAISLPAIPSHARASEGKDLDLADTQTFAGGRAAMLPIFNAFRRAVDQQFPDTTWRALKRYVAAETADDTFMALYGRTQAIVVGLTLPPDYVGPRLFDNDGEFKWARMTKIVMLASETEVDNALLAHIAEARAHAARSHVARTRHSTHFGVSLRDLIGARLLASGTELVLIARGNRVVAQATLGESGEILWEGSAYRSPSDDSFAPLLGVSKFNGWAYWHAELPSGRVTLATVRAGMIEAGSEDQEAQPEIDADVG